MHIYIIFSSFSPEGLSTLINRTSSNGTIDFLFFLQLFTRNSCQHLLPIELDGHFAVTVCVQA